MAPSFCHWKLSGMLGFYSCSQLLQRQTLEPSLSIVHLFRHWNPTMILRMVIISIMTIIRIMSIIASILIIWFRLAGICGLSSCVRAWLQEACSLLHPHSKYFGKTCSCTCWRHQNHSVPPVQRLSGCTRWPQAGCRWRMLDVVCQLVGIGMVLWSSGTLDQWILKNKSWLTKTYPRNL